MVAPATLPVTQDGLVEQIWRTRLQKQLACGKSFEELISGLDYSQLDPLRESCLNLEVVKWPGQWLFALNTRQLFCLKQSKVAKVHVTISTLPPPTNKPYLWLTCTNKGSSEVREAALRAQGITDERLDTAWQNKECIDGNW